MISALIPVSSKVSLSAVSSMVSPFSLWPLGKPTLLEKDTRRTSLSLKTTQPALSVVSWPVGIQTEYSFSLTLTLLATFMEYSVDSTSEVRTVPGSPSLIISPP